MWAAWGLRWCGEAIVGLTPAPDGEFDRMRHQPVSRPSGRQQRVGVGQPSSRPAVWTTAITATARGLSGQPHSKARVGR